MMHRYGSGNSQGGHVMGACTCGMYHEQTDDSYSMATFFSMPSHQPCYQEEDDIDDYDHQHYTNSYSPVVDCTLSLGTPSTRFLTDQDHDQKQRTTSSHQRRASSITKFFSNSSKNKSNRSGLTNCSSNNNDSLLARRCANCDTTSTPLWRNGPRGPKSLCNACGIRYKKEERRAAAAAAAATSEVATGGVMESGNHHAYGHHNNPWYANQQSQMYGDSENNGIPFLSWRLKR